MKIGILGATGLVGLELLDLIPRAWPGAELHLYASKAQTLTHAGKSYAVSAASDLERVDAPKGDLAFVALDDEHSARYVPRLLSLGYRVIDKSNTYRGDPNVPLVVAGVNCAQVNEKIKLVANPNCTTIPLTMCLSVLRKAFGVEDITVSTYQAISGAGKATLQDFLSQAKAGYDELTASGDLLGQSLKETSYVGNVVPHNAKTDEGGFSAEERKLIQESKKILDNAELSISVQCCRVPVTVGHYENVWVTFGEATNIAEVEAALKAASTKWITAIPGSAGDGLTALSCLRHRDRALVGRVRRDVRDRDGKTFCMTIVGDNLRLGAATNAVRVAARWFPAKDAELKNG